MPKSRALAGRLGRVMEQPRREGAGGGGPSGNAEGDGGAAAGADESGTGENAGTRKRPPEGQEVEPSRAQRQQALLIGQTEVLELIATGASLPESLDALVHLIEAHAPGLLCTVLLLDPDGLHLRHGAAPSLPREYVRAIDGKPVGEVAGSCGTAAFRGESVIVEDVETDPLWGDYREIALRHGLRACWSTPIFDADRRVLGTFALYYREPRKPSQHHRELIDIATHIAAIAISRQRVEDEARLQMERLTLATDAAGIAVWDWNIACDTWYCTSTYFTMLGYQPGREARWEQWRERFHPDDRRAVEQSMRAIESGSTEPYRIEARIRHADGTYRWISDVGRVVATDASGKAARVLGVRLDISVRKQAETAVLETAERFRQVVENIQEVFWVTNPADGTLSYVSPAYEKIWGRPRDELYRSSNKWPPAVHPADREPVEEACRVAHESGTLSVTYRITRPDGSVRWIHDRAYPIRDADGRLSRIVGTAEDVTEQRDAEDARAALELRLRQAQKMEAIGTLAGGIAHDFNNILAVINGYADLTRMAAADNQEIIEYASAIADSGERAAKLVRQILTFSRREESKREAIQLRPVVEEALRFLRATIPSTILFEVALDVKAPAVLADATQVHQVLMNLATNAWHAMRERGSGRLSVTLAIVELGSDSPELRVSMDMKPGRYVRLSLTDNGTGMTPETMSRIFEPFFTTKQPGEGTGLGLSVVHGIMRNHEGGVVVKSQPGAGTTIELFFPALQPAHAHTSDARRSQAAPGAGERILLVDDEETVAAMAKKVLDRLGYATEAFTAPVAALEALRSAPQNYELVITDLTMPGMTGTELARQITEVRPDLPIILTTGHTAALSPGQVRSMGIKEVLQKPLTIQELSDAVQRVLAESKPR